MIQFNFETEKETLHCSFSGRMDSPTSMEVEKVIQNKFREVTSKTPADKLGIVFDLADVDYIASAFIRICLETAKMTGNKRFSVTNTKPFVMKIFKVAGLDKELNVT